MKRNLTFAAALVMLAANTVKGGPAPPAADDAATNRFTLNWVIGEVVTNDPSLKAARANWEAMKERIPQARAWEDPRAGVDATLARFVDVPPNSFMNQKFTVEQTLPISGKNRLRGDAASAEAAGAFGELQRRELDELAKARTAYYNLAGAYAQLELNRKDAALLKQFVDISRAKYEAGSHSQADVLSAETELARLEEAAFDFERQISEAQTQLNALMNRPPKTALARPVSPEFKPVNLDADKIQALAVVHRPELFVAEQKIAAAQAKLEAARKGWVPEPAFRVEGDRYNDSSQVISEVSAGFSINLPWFNRKKYKADIRENQKLVESAQNQLDAERILTSQLVEDQVKRVETFHHHTELYQAKLVPLAQQTVAAKRLSYETDRAAFLELLAAQRTVQEMEASYWDHLIHYEMALAELEALVGAPVNSAESVTEHHHETK